MENAALGKQSRSIWKWALLAVLVSVIVCAGVFAVYTYGVVSYRNRLGGTMQQLFAAFQLYAETSAGNYYPLRSAEPERFLPDMEAWAEVGGDGMAEFEAAYRAFRADDERPLCYLGYAFYDEASAHRVLDQLEKDPQVYRGGGTRLEKEPFLDPFSSEFDELHPLREGVGRRFSRAWYVLWGPGAGDPFDNPIPILWQMPKRKGDRVPVLRMSGSVRFEEYPGDFPMSPLFINRLRGLMGLPQDPDFSMDTPILPIVWELLEAGSREPGPRAGSLLHFDVEPTVLVGNAKGYRIELTHAELVLFPGGTMSDPVTASKLFESVDDEYFGLPRERVVRYMGAGKGYCWYGRTDYGVFVLLQKAFGLTGGESLYDAAASYWLDEFPNRAWLQPFRPDKRRTAVILQRPSSLAAYVHALITERQRRGSPVREEFVQAVAVLCGSEHWEPRVIGAAPTSELCAEARERLVVASKDDSEAVVTLVLPYIFPRPIKGSRERAEPDKIDFLRRFPRDTVLSTVRHLSENLQDAHEASLCQSLLEELEVSPAGSDQREGE